MTNTLKCFHEILIVPASLLRIHLICLHSCVDHFKGISEHSGYNPTKQMSVHIEIRTTVSPWIIYHLIVEIQKATRSSSRVSESSEYECVDVAEHFTNSTPRLMDFMEDSKRRIAFIVSNPLKKLAFLEHNLTHFYKIHGLCKSMRD